MLIDGTGTGIHSIVLNVFTKYFQHTMKYIICIIYHKVTGNATTKYAKQLWHDFITWHTKIKKMSCI